MYLVRDKTFFFPAGFNRLSENRLKPPDGNMKRLQIVRENGVFGSKTCFLCRFRRTFFYTETPWMGRSSIPAWRSRSSMKDRSRIPDIVRSTGSPCQEGPVYNIHQYSLHVYPLCSTWFRGLICRTFYADTAQTSLTTMAGEELDGLDDLWSDEELDDLDDL